MNPMNIERGMDKAVKVVFEDLTAQAATVSKTSTVHSVASLPGRASLSPHSPMESRSLARHQPIDARGVAMYTCV